MRFGAEVAGLGEDDAQHHQRRPQELQPRRVPAQDVLWGAEEEGELIMSSFYTSNEQTGYWVWWMGAVNESLFLDHFNLLSHRWITMILIYCFIHVYCISPLQGD